MIECSHLSKRYGDRIAVDDVSFAAPPGQITGLLGPNGAGKSTALRLILGLDHGGGSARIDGLPFSRLPDPVRQVGAVLEARSFHPGRTARNHVRMLAAGGGIPRRRVGEVLDLVGLASAADRRPGGFSLGMAQRLGLATALLRGPGAIILDEPGNGLDPAGLRWLRTLLREFAAQGRTVLIASHQLTEMEVLADQLIIFGRGRIIATGTVRELVDRSGLGTFEEAYLQLT